MIGDADDGRLFRFHMSEPINDHRHILSLGAVLFERCDFKQAACAFSQDALFLLGAEGFERFLKIRALELPRASQHFASGGFVIMRSSEIHMNVLAKQVLRLKLRVYAGAEHPHEAQQPAPLTVYAPKAKRTK